MSRKQQLFLVILIFAVVIGGCYYLSSQPTPFPPPQFSQPVASVPTARVDSFTPSTGPVPLLSSNHPVDWWFVFKFNSAGFPGCSTAITNCRFGGTPQDYKASSQQFVMASSEHPSLTQGNDCLGTQTTDPVGATFDEVYNRTSYYVIWNDQFYDDPHITGCTKECSAPWGHSKGMVAWNDKGEGMVMQVTTPSWPAAGNKDHSRQTDGNTLGCVKDDDVKVSQHFFSLKLNKDDLVKVLKALQNSSVVTAPSNPQIVHNGGPGDVQQLVNSLGVKSSSERYLAEQLSSGVELISKPSRLHVPPWQMVSAILNGVSLRTATWWTRPAIPSTDASTQIACWDNSLGKPGPVEIATTGQWNGVEVGLKGGPGSDFNHAKLGVSVGGDHHYSVFGDMNQQGTLSGPNCASSQNGRGGMFFVLDNTELHQSLGKLIQGKTD